MEHKEIDNLKLLVAHKMLGTIFDDLVEIEHLCKKTDRGLRDAGIACIKSLKNYVLKLSD